MSLILSLKSPKLNKKPKNKVNYYKEFWSLVDTKEICSIRLFVEKKHAEQLLQFRVPEEGRYRVMRVKIEEL